MKNTPRPLVALALALVAVTTGCAGTAAQPTANHPANPSAARGPETPPFTTLAGNDLPEVEPAQQPADGGAAAEHGSEMEGMHHHKPPAAPVRGAR